jgi:hypothetical protein
LPSKPCLSNEYMSVMDCVYENGFAWRVDRFTMSVG